MGRGSHDFAPVRDLVLVGGGHAHVQVLRRIGMVPLPGVRVTVIAREPHTPYSGMLPGHVAGAYTADELHIDLGPLCRFAGARLLCHEVVGMELEQRRLLMHGHPTLRFDLLSLNIGASPRAVAVADDETLGRQPALPLEPPLDVGHQRVVRVKPIGRFLPSWAACRANLKPDDRILLIGAGAGAVELAFAMRAVLPSTVGIALVGRTLLPGFNERARARIRLRLGSARIALLERDPVVRIDSDGAITEAGEQLKAEYYFDVTSVQAPGWLTDTGLLLDDDGFVRVDEHLRSLSHSFVFAAGDIAHLDGQPRPKSGVYAVRAGPVLAENLRRSWTDLPLKRFKAQEQALAILGLGGGRALAVRGPFCAQGRWVWWLKDRIDRRFMERFQRLPEMHPPLPPPQLREALKAELPDPMRCGGCGGKVAAPALAAVLDSLPEQRHPLLIEGREDDAARLYASSADRSEILATIDGFSAFVDDPYRFGRIATHHALGDVIAMGGKPTAALVLATLPPMAEPLMAEDLALMMTGVTEVLAEEGAVLAGGHSAEGAAMALGLTVLGQPGERLLRKGGLVPGTRLVLTKALGTGALLAAAMRGRCPTRVLLAALERMDQSNSQALEVALSEDVQGATDITGFGLLGHLAEMLVASELGATLWLDSLPVLPGAEAVFAGPVRSTLQPANRRVLKRFRSAAGDRLDASADWRLDLLCDPQTAGGLLLAIPAAQADSCVAALRAAGYGQACAVGEVRGDGAWIIAEGGAT